jgi:DNA helicase-2/ATP-dependent DNA helicase PcrA
MIGVADDDQAIYAWRGARPENVVDFIKVFGCTTLNMGYNFRSAKRIVESSSKLIENNKSRIKKIIRPFKDELGQVISYQTQSVFTEIDYIITKCKQYPDKEIAILYRNRTYKNHLEFELKKAKLEYCINDSLDICDRSAIKVMLSCMRISAMIGDIYDLEIAAKGIKGIGKTTVDKLRKEITPDNNLSSILREKFQDPKQARRFKSLIDMTNWFSLHKDSNLDLLARHIETLFIPSFDYQPDMKTFILDITKCYKINISDIRDLCNDLGLDGKEEHNDENATIELSTVHGYKGLEKDIVIMPWTQMYLDDTAWKEINIEDERRLFYVGTTRAKEKLFMSYCGNKPRFIKEMGI